MNLKKENKAESSVIFGKKWTKDFLFTSNFSNIQKKLYSKEYTNM